MAEYKSDPETIILKGTPIFKEGKTDEKLSPGHIIEIGGTEDIQKQSTAQQDCQRNIVVENDLDGKTIEDEYAANARVFYGTCQPGVEVLARVAAAAPAITKGNFLEAKGDGTVRKLTAGGTAIGIALEALDNTAGTKEVFIQMEVK